MAFSSFTDVDLECSDELWVAVWVQNARTYVLLTLHLRDVCHCIMDCPYRVEDVKSDNRMVGHVSVRHFCICLSLCVLTNTG